MAVLSGAWSIVGPGLKSAALIWAAFVLDGCGQDSSIKHERFGFHTVESFDVVAEDDRLHLLLAVREAENAPIELIYTQSEDAGRHWSLPVSVEAHDATPHKPHGGRDIKLAVRGDHRIALWSTTGSGYMGSGPMASALSSDGGKTWVAGPNPADDGSNAGHGFHALATDDNGVHHLAWLDSRPGQQGLIYARSQDHGRSWSENQIVDATTCQCCWNTLLPLDHDAIRLLYRDDEPRDMALASSSDAGQSWHTGMTVGEFDWSFNGCPHAGGALARTEQRGELHALVWTGREGRQGLYVLGSADGGMNWSPPRRVGGQRAKHGDIAALKTNVLAVWDEIDQSSPAIAAALSRDAGKTWGSAQRLYSGAEAVSHPKVVSMRQGFVVLWTQRESDKGRALVLRRL